MKKEILQKYPRIPHLPWSPGRTDDDIFVGSLKHLEIMKEIVVTEKLDGENTAIYRDHSHARSVDSKSHPSRDWVRSLQNHIGYNIPENMRICGENLFGRHSIYYNKLTTYFYVFSIFVDNLCLSWDETVKWCSDFGLETVPVLYRGEWNENKIKACFSGRSSFGDDQEGYVVRNANSFLFEEFGRNAAKYVKLGYVSGEEHWLKKWEKGIPVEKLKNHLVNKENVT